MYFFLDLPKCAKTGAETVAVLIAFKAFSCWGSQQYTVSFLYSLCTELANSDRLGVYQFSYMVSPRKLCKYFKFVWCLYRDYSFILLWINLQTFGVRTWPKKGKPVDLNVNWFGLSVMLFMYAVSRSIKALKNADWWTPLVRISSAIPVIPSNFLMILYRHSWNTLLVTLRLNGRCST